MELILTILIIIVALILVGVFMRRKVYQRVDALEEKESLFDESSSSGRIG